MSVAGVESPYRGLRPFEDSDVDALLFFGREHETEVIAANLQAARLTVLYGPSGVGKSSVLRAGVVRRLRADGDLVVRFESWSGDPVEGIAAAVRAEVAARLGEEPPDEPGSLAERLGAWSRLAGGDLHLVLDQVEEYFLYHGRNGRPDALLAELPDVVNEPGLRVQVLLGIREDALALLDAFKARIPQVLGNYLRLDRLDRAAGEAAVLGPLAAWHELTGEEVAAEPELVEALLDEVSVDGGRVEAPYLQVVLERVWEAERAAGSALLRRETLARLGGASHIVDEHLERALAGLAGPERDTAAAIFAHLVTPGGTKIAHELRDLASYAGTDVRDVASALVRERILRPVDGGSNGGRVEIYHDVLAGAVADWRRRHETERQLARERRRQRKLLATVGVLVVGLALMTGLAVYALSQREEAQDRARSAAARELTAHALTSIDVDPELSLLLALEAASLEQTRQVEDALRTALAQSHVRAIRTAVPPVHAVALAPPGEPVVVDDRRRRLARATTTPALTPDAATLVFGRGASIVVVRKGREETIASEPAPAVVAVSGDGRVVAAADETGVVRVYAVSTRALLAVRRAPDVRLLALDRSGRRLAVASGRAVRVWDLRGQRNGTFVMDRATVTALGVSSDGRTLATGSADGAARVRDASSGRVVIEFPNHRHHVTAVAFDAEGTHLATASRDGVAYTWRVEDGHLLGELRGHTDAISAVAFGADGGRVVTAAADGTARVWVSGAAPELEPVMRGTVPVLDAAVRDDGRIVAVDEDGVVVDGSRLVRAGRPLAVGAVSADGEYAVGAAGGSATIWRVRDGAVAAILRVPERIASAAVSEAHVVVGTTSGVAWVRPLGSPRRLALRGEGGAVTAVALSPDGAHVATGMANGDVLLWQLSTPRQPLRELRGHRDLVAGISFSSAGSRLATASRDHDARTWSVATGRLERVLVGHFAIVSDASFSPDGRYVVTAGPSTAGLWYGGDGSSGLLRGHTDRVVSASFAPDGRTLVTASRDGTVRRYRCDICGTLDGLVQVGRERIAATGRRLTARERRRFLGDG